MTLDALTPPFRDKVEQLLEMLADKGVRMKPYCTIRDPFEQARLWRQSRSGQQIKTMCARLRATGAPRIAECIESVGPQSGKPVTNAAPGYSWHQHGEAVDCFLIDADGGADWDANARGYVEYARTATALGLRAGRDFRDPPHVQYRHHEPHHDNSPQRIELMLAERFPRFAAL
jgi:peptidoglycan L-alanyl-D-glutamate endopeptidase CwlK